MDTAQMDKAQPGTAQKNGFVWFEMQFSDVNRAMKFYGNLFGWEFTGMEGMAEMEGMEGMPETPYYMVNTGEGSLGGGFSQRPAGESAAQGTPDCLLYIGVAHVANTIARATELGASVHIPPTPIPTSSGEEEDCFAWLKDPDGVTFGIVGPAATK